MKIFIDDIGKCGLVYETIKVGFPEGEVIKLDGRGEAHHEIICWLVNVEHEPFWIVDTDVIFYKRMPDAPITPMYGEYQLGFHCPITGKDTQPRINPACMRIDPIAFRKAWTEAASLSPVARYAPLANVINPIVIGHRFWDVLAVGYLSIPNILMPHVVTDCFVHLHCGSWLDVASQHIPGLADIHANPPRTQEAGMRLREIQHEFYRTHAPQ